MRQNAFEKELAELIRPEVESLGFSFWGLTSPSAGKKRVIRIYIDGPEGVNIDDCAQVSRQVGLVLEVEDIINGAFNLEVSSPGLERKFFTLEQLVGYEGRTLEVKLAIPVNNRRNFKGVLKEITPSGIVLDMKDEDVRLDWDTVKEAKLVHEF
ncbi:ribosome maturation factor RimP [Salidesulfovibrio onnuriiensis]|uniref:ribosome maturation factor RimP n=1 Tax=Salidesulfovibrio onnuriiensis TaxID=2583823 RepID=UPI0011C79C7B|nr:ribosome maturation factor RimP [Salidesulfovibrio onnuriiensis]